MGTDYSPGAVDFTHAGAAMMTVRDRRGGFVEETHVIPPKADEPAMIVAGDRRLTVDAVWALARAYDLMVANARGLNGDRFS